jgi:hypothetical protein
LALKSPNKIFIWYFGYLSNTCSSSSWNLFFISSVLSSVGSWTFTSNLLVLHMTSYH